MNRISNIVSLIVLTAALAMPAAYGQDAASNTFAAFRGDVTHIGFVDTPIGSNLALQWQFSRPSSHRNSSSPVVTGKSVIFGLGPHVYSVSTQTGALLWQYPKEGDDAGQIYNCPPAYAAGKVYIGNDDGNLYAFDATTGSVIWSKKTDWPVHTAPIVVDGIVYFGSGTDLNALDAATGKPIWSNPVETQTDIITSPVVANGNIYVVDGTGTLFAASVNSGRPLWNTPVSGSPVTEGALVYDRMSLFFRNGHSIVVLNGRGGDAKGQIDMGSDIIGPITITDDGSYIVPTADLKLTSLDNRGRKQWVTTLGDYPLAPPLATRFHLFVCTNYGIIYELDRATGAVKWDYTIQPVAQKAGKAPAKNAPIFAAPVVANHTLYVLSDDGTLSAFKETAPDNLQPVISALYPAPDATVGGKVVPYKVVVADTGSGVRPDTVALTVDNKTIPVDYDLNSTTVHVRYQSGDLGMGLPVVLDELADGKHTATFTCTDWRGNKLTHSWSFRVDKAKDSIAVNTTPVPVSSSGQPLPQQTNTASDAVQTAPNAASTANGNLSATAQRPVQQANVAGGAGQPAQAVTGQQANQPAQPAQPTQTTQAAQSSPPQTISVPSTGEPTAPPPPGPDGTSRIPAGNQGGPPPPPPI